MKSVFRCCAIVALGCALPPSVMAQQGGKPQVFTAPFTIVGSNGQPLMELKETTDGPTLTLMTPGGAHITMGASRVGMAISVVNDDQHFITLNAGRQASIVSAVYGPNSVSFVADATQQHLIIGKEDKPVVDLGSKPGTNAALRIAAPNGTVVAQLGSSQSHGGSGALLIGDTTGVTTAYAISEDSNTASIGITIGGKDVVRLEPNVSGSGGKVSVATTGGSVMFNAGVTTGGEGAACVTSLANGQKCFQ